MNILKRIATATAVAGFAFTGAADTITFPDGSTMDGTVAEINENCIELTANGTTIQFQRSEIASFEKNTKLPEGGKAPVIPMVAQWEKDMQDKTGLSSEQREKVMSLLEALVRTEDSEKHKELTQDLIALNKSVDILKFIKNTFHDSGVSQQMERLEAYLILDPNSALPFLQQGAVTAYPPMRILAINGLADAVKKAGKTDAATVKLFARGLLDVDTDVQIASGHALAAAGDKSATPVLLGALKAADPRVRNVAQSALCRLWNVDAATLPEVNAEYWADYWKQNSATVKNALAPEGLAPLVDRDAPVLVAHH